MLAASLSIKQFLNKILERQVLADKSNDVGQLVARDMHGGALIKGSGIRWLDNATKTIQVVPHPHFQHVINLA